MQDLLLKYMLLLWSIPSFQTFVYLAVAFVLGTLIGFERQYRQRTAGLRTNVLVAVGAAAFTDLGVRLLGDEGATRIIAYVVSGIGFLGAGVILKDGAQIRGLNTAATLWCSAAVGAFSGAGLPLEAGMLAVFVLAGNTLLRPLVNYVNRRPMNRGQTEAKYQVHAICKPADVNDVRDLLSDALDATHYPVLEFRITTDGDDSADVTATLVPTEADRLELEAVVVWLEKSAKVASATWTVETAG
jgi:putative Mg2+ transporter-C (MgtC) family protein